MLLIFDTNGGLCNQFYDILNGIHFCLKYNIYFTFRYCSFRNDNLISWTETPFEKLFDLNFLNKYKLYVNYYNIKNKLTCDNCFNLNDNILSHNFFKPNNILDQLTNLNKDYVVLKQFWSLNNFQDINRSIDPIYPDLYPCKDIMEKYIEIKNTIIGDDEGYNFIHYRYEKDFTDHFKVNIESLDSLLERIEFKNNKLKIFIATSNITKLLDLNNSKYKNLIYKNDNMNLNYEQQAFIDYMFGINSVECYGNKKSSFSIIINNIKQSNNYYA